MKRIIIVLVVLGAILLSSSLYTVNETQVAIKLRLGEIVSVENEPGLKFKTPFVNNVVSFDKRIQTLDSAAESFLTVEKKNVVVDSYVKWRIVDTEKFYISTGGAMASANLRLAQNNQDALRTEFSKRTIIEVVSDEREAIMASVKTKLKTIAEDEFGIEVKEEYGGLYTINENTMPIDIQVLINDGEIGLAMLRIIEIIGEDELKNLGSETLYFLVNALNQMDIDLIRNEILSKILPVRV